MAAVGICSRQATVRFGCEMAPSADAVVASSLIKRLLSATVLGAVSGLVCVGVRVALNLLQQLLTGSAGLLAESAQHMPPWRRVATPALGGLLAMAVLFLAARMLPREEPVDYVDAIRKQKPIPLLSAVVRVISSGFSIATGAAIGREGSMIQFATACVSGVADLRPTWFPDRRRYLAYGLAAAVGSVYRAPFAGIFFATEIGFGCLDFRETVPLALASGMAGCAAASCFGRDRSLRCRRPCIYGWPRCFQPCC